MGTSDRRLTQPGVGYYTSAGLSGKMFCLMAFLVPLTLAAIEDNEQVKTMEQRLLHMEEVAYWNHQDVNAMRRSIHSVKTDIEDLNNRTKEVLFYKKHPMEDRVRLIEDTMEKNIQEINVALKSLKKSVKQFGISINDLSKKTIDNSNAIATLKTLGDRIASMWNKLEMETKENAIIISALKNNSLIASNFTSQAMDELRVETQNEIERSKTNMLNQIERSVAQAVIDAKKQISIESLKNENQVQLLNIRLELIDAKYTDMDGRVDEIDQNIKGIAGKWFNGSYCILANGGCPLGFTRHEGFLRAVRMFNSLSDNYVREATFGDSSISCHDCEKQSIWAELYLTACCK